MTPEAKEFAAQTVRWSKTHLKADYFHVLKDYGGSTPGRSMHQWILMQLTAGGGLLAEDPLDAETGIKPPYYLDDGKVRAFLAGQQRFHPLEVYHHADHGEWGGYMVTRGGSSNRDTFGRRYYAIDTSADQLRNGWGLTQVPSAAERDRENSFIDPAAVVLPDFETVFDTTDIAQSTLYRAIGW